MCESVYDVENGKAKVEREEAKAIFIDVVGHCAKLYG